MSNTYGTDSPNWQPPSASKMRQIYAEFDELRARVAKDDLVHIRLRAGLREACEIGSRLAQGTATLADIDRLIELRGTLTP